MSLVYYASVIDGNRKGLLGGPYDTHQEALDKVDVACSKACELDLRAHFYAYGTCSIDLEKWGDRPLPQGVLNQWLNN